MLLLTKPIHSGQYKPLGVWLWRRPFALLLSSIGHHGHIIVQAESSSVFCHKQLDISFYVTNAYIWPGEFVICLEFTELITMNVGSYWN